MNKYQKALNEMYAVLNDSERWHTHKKELQELVNKETPITPSHKHKFVHDDTTYNLGRCPKCTYEVKIKMAYCSNCGQKLDWSE